MAAAQQRSYQYSLLKDIQVGQTVNVYGIVKYFRQPSRTRGSDYSMFISIIDDSGGDKLKCLIFSRDIKLLPPVQNVGDIVRFHRLQVKVFNDDIQGQGQCSRGFSALVFPGNVGASLTPEATTANYTCTQDDLNRVITLREWADQEDDVLSQIANSNDSTNSTKTQLCNVQLNMFFDLICQVVCKYRVVEKCMVLRVWDGTQVACETKSEDMTRQQDVIGDVTLQTRVGNLAADIYVFDDHFDSACKVQPGDYIQLVNVHAAQYPGNYVHHTVIPVELTLHGGGAQYGRAVHVLDPQHDDVTSLRDRLQNINSPSPVSQGQGCETPSHNDEHRNHRNKDSESNQSNNQGGSHGNKVSHHGGVCELPGATSYHNKDRCMLSTATVLTDNHSQPGSCLREVVQHTVPHKFHVLCHVQDYSPRPSRPTDLLRLYCNQCKYSSPVPGCCGVKTSQGPRFLKHEDGVDIYSCPSCTRLSTNKVLEYVMMLQLLLYDETGWIVVGLWAQQAEKFFRGIGGKEILQDKTSFLYVKKRLNKLLPAAATSGLDLRQISPQKKPSGPKSGQSLPNVGQRGPDSEQTESDISQSPHKSGPSGPVKGSGPDSGATGPLLECCVKSYMTEGGVCYQLFDTCLEWSNEYDGSLQ